MTRTLPEWIGKTHDSAIPARVKMRLFERCGGRCEACTSKFMGVKKPEYDHIIALVNGGQNRETNLQVVCSSCHKGKTKVDVATKSKTARVKAKHLGIRKTRNPMPGSKASKWKRRMDGTTVLRGQ